MTTFLNLLLTQTAIRIKPYLVIFIISKKLNFRIFIFKIFTCKSTFWWINSPATAEAAPVFVIILQKIKRGQNYLCSYEICVDDFFKRMKFEFYLIAVNIIAYIQQIILYNNKRQFS